MKKRVVLFLCDPVLRKLFARKLEAEGFDVVQVAEVGDLVRKASGKPVAGVLLDLSCALTPEELIKKVTASPVLNRAFRALYSPKLLPQDIDAIRQQKVQAVYIGSLMSPQEIVEHFSEELSA